MARVILQPSGNKDAREHYDNTIKNPVDIEKIYKHIDDHDNDKLISIYGTQKLIPVWGVTPGVNEVNKRKWDKIGVGDVTLFAANGKIFASGVVTYKVHKQKLASELWGFDNSGQTWEYVYFLDEVRSQDISYIQFNKVAGYSENNVIQGFSVLDEEKSQDLIDTFDLSSHTHFEYVTNAEYENVVLNLDPNKPLDGEGKVRVRKEQSFLRRHLFSNKRVGICGICGNEFPIGLLVAAHVKKRSTCSIEERLDYKNIVMPMCKLGCDDLFEKGFIKVDQGKIARTQKHIITSVLEQYISKLEGKNVSHWNKYSSKYFEWHFKLNS